MLDVFHAFRSISFIILPHLIDQKHPLPMGLASGHIVIVIIIITVVVVDVILEVALEKRHDNM